MRPWIRALAIIAAGAWLWGAIIAMIESEWAVGIGLMGMTVMLFTVLTAIARARESGYWLGRASVYNSMTEARLRGMTWEQWLEAEAERTMMTRGHRS